MDSIDPVMSQGPTKFFAAYKQISLIGSVPTKFTINSTTNWGLCLQAALACLPTLSGPALCWALDRVTYIVACMFLKRKKRIL